MLDQHIPLDREQSFIVGAMAYWESLASFIVDQSLDSLDYLSPFCSFNPSGIVYPNPGTGICTPLFIYLARVGTLLRQKRLLDRLNTVRRPRNDVRYDSGLHDDANHLHSLILEFRTPSLEIIAPTGDVNTPVSHLCDMARIYRLVNILELYQAFPLLARERHNISEDLGVLSSMIFDIATSILGIIRDLPRNSGIFTVLGLALISAGSALQNPYHSPRGESSFNLQAELERGRTGESALAYWRNIFHEQILHTHKQCGISAILRADELIRCVWRRADSAQESDARTELSSPLHWMDIMTDQQMETLYG